MKASIRCGKSLALALTFLLALIMIMPTNRVYATSTYTATGTETADEITKIIDGTTKDLSGNAYDVIEFPAGTYDYNMTAPVHIRRTVTIHANAGAKVTFNGGDFRGYANSKTTFSGSGSFLLKNPINYGIWSNDGTVTFNFEHTNFTIDGAPGFGFYALINGNTTNINGGTFTIKNCAQSGNEGGLEFDGGNLNVSDGAQMLIENNGNGVFGDLYMNGNMTVTGTNTKVTINEKRAGAGYGMVIPSSGHLKVDGATFEINTNSAGKGINAAGNASNTIELVNGAKLNIKATGGLAKSGVRRAKVTVSENSVLNVEGYDYAFDGSMLVTKDKAHVTLKGKIKDNGSIVGFTGGTNGSVIMGGSVLENPAKHVVNGVEEPVPTGSAVDTQPVNISGETLTRFNITGFNNKTINISGDPNDPAHPSYTYNVGDNHNGVAYVWAPAVKINFWQNKDAFDNNDATKLAKTLTTVRGNTMGLVGGTIPSGPAAPVGKVFSHWVNAETGQKIDESSAFTKAVTDVYAVYKDVAAQPPIKQPSKTVNVDKAKNPNTGDDSSMILYIGILASTLLAFTVSIRLRYRA